MGGMKKDRDFIQARISGLLGIEKAMGLTNGTPVELLTFEKALFPNVESVTEWTKKFLGGSMKPTSETGNAYQIRPVLKVKPVGDAVVVGLAGGVLATCWPGSAKVEVIEKDLADTLTPEPEETPEAVAEGAPTTPDVAEEFKCNEHAQAKIQKMDNLADSLLEDADYAEAHLASLKEAIEAAASTDELVDDIHRMTIIEENLLHSIQEVEQEIETDLSQTREMFEAFKKHSDSIEGQISSGDLDGAKATVVALEEELVGLIAVFRKMSERFTKALEQIKGGVTKKADTTQWKHVCQCIQAGMLPDQAVADAHCKCHLPTEKDMDGEAIDDLVQDVLYGLEVAGRESARLSPVMLALQKSRELVAKARPNKEQKECINATVTECMRRGDVDPDQAVAIAYKKCGVAPNKDLSNMDEVVSFIRFAKEEVDAVMPNEGPVPPAPGSESESESFPYETGSGSEPSATEQSSMTEVTAEPLGAETVSPENPNLIQQVDNEIREAEERLTNIRSGLAQASTSSAFLDAIMTLRRLYQAVYSFLESVEIRVGRKMNKQKDTLLRNMMAIDGVDSVASSADPMDVRWKIRPLADQLGKILIDTRQLVATTGPKHRLNFGHEERPASTPDAMPEQQQEQARHGHGHDETTESTMTETGGKVLEETGADITKKDRLPTIADLLKAQK